MKIVEDTPGKLVITHRFVASAIELVLLSAGFFGLAYLTSNFVAFLSWLLVVLALLNTAFLLSRVGTETLTLDRDKLTANLEVCGLFRQCSQSVHSLSEINGVDLEISDDPEERDAARIMLTTENEPIALTRHRTPRAATESVAGRIQAWLAES